MNKAEYVTACVNRIEEKRDQVIRVSDKVWEYAETSLREEKSCALYVEVLKEEGFEVEEEFCGIPTAFAASFGAPVKPTLPPIIRMRP